MTEHAHLLAMTFQGRWEWMVANTRFLPVLGQWIVKVDGHLAAMGTDYELETDMLARFLMFIARPALSKRIGGMG